MVLWGSFGPIMDSAPYAFHWDDWYIALLEAWGTIFSLIFMIPMNWANQKYGTEFKRLGLAKICLRTRV